MSEILGNTTTTPIDPNLFGGSDGTVGKKTEQGGEIFNDYENNKAVSEYSTASGHNTVAGLRGFNIKLLSPPQYKTIKLDSVEGLTQGDIISIITAKVELNYATIISVHPQLNEIQINKELDFELNTKETTDCEYNYLFVVDKPTIGTTDISEYAFACGYNNLSLGKAAYTEGANNISSGWYSHTEGRGNEATDYNAHAEGRQTKAKANSAHSEGRFTEALAPYTHSEGYNTKARANGSHTEGTDTETTGWYAHAENYGTKASGTASHAQNARNEAAGDNSHAGGSDCLADGSQAFVHGKGLKSVCKGYRITGIRRKADNSRDIITVETTEGLRSGGLDIISLYIGGVRIQSYIGEVYNDTEFETVGNTPWVFTPDSYMVVENNDVGYEIGIDNQAVFGTFNDFVPGALFAIGNGTDDVHRSNAFEVYEDGHAEVQTMGDTDKSVVNKGYVDELTGNIETALDELHNYAQLLANGGAV